jgi:hypothetical protein
MQEELNFISLPSTVWEMSLWLRTPLISANRQAACY